MDAVEELAAIFKSLKVINHDEEINEIMEHEEKAKEMCGNDLKIQSEICKIKEEIKQLMLDESGLHKTLKSNAEEISVLRAYLAVRKNILNTTPEVMREYKGIFSKQADLVSSECNNLMKHFGFKVDMQQIDADVWRAKFIFLENGEIILDFDIVEKTFNLQSMTPIHPNFDDLKTFLHETQDVSGFMFRARKYFLSLR